MGSSSYGGMTIYLDDQHSGYEIYGNLFEACNSLSLSEDVITWLTTMSSSIAGNQATWTTGHGMQKKPQMTRTRTRRYLRNMPPSELWQTLSDLVNILDDDLECKEKRAVRNVSAGGVGRYQQLILQYQTVKDNVVFDDEPD